VVVEGEGDQGARLKVQGGVRPSRALISDEPFVRLPPMNILIEFIEVFGSLSPPIFPFPSQPPHPHPHPHPLAPPLHRPCTLHGSTGYGRFPTQNSTTLVLSLCYPCP
jgi:hypothetical protein